MDAEQILKELTEEIRTNTRLRHRLGMEEGSESVPVQDGDDKGLVLTTADGESFAVVVVPAA